MCHNFHDSGFLVTGLPPAQSNLRVSARAPQVLKALSASEGAAHAQRIRSLGAGGSRGGRPQFRRSHLVKPKDHWPPTVGSTGLTMELVRTDAATGAAVFRYAHTAAYRAAHEAYEECVHSHDPNTIVQLLQHYPYHVEALLALSELMGYSGEPQQARGSPKGPMHIARCDVAIHVVRKRVPLAQPLCPASLPRRAPTFSSGRCTPSSSRGTPTSSAPCQAGALALVPAVVFRLSMHGPHEKPRCPCLGGSRDRAETHRGRCPTEAASLFRFPPVAQDGKARLGRGGEQAALLCAFPVRFLAQIHMFAPPFRKPFRSSGEEISHLTHLPLSARRRRRHVCMIGRKGCVRSALECCKMLLSLDPRDPQGALYQLDFFALRSGQLEWLLRFLPQHREGSLMSMPSSVYSYALATLFLRQAIDGGERKDPAQLEEAKAALAGTTGVEGTMRHALLLHPAVRSHPRITPRLLRSRPATTHQ